MTRRGAQKAKIQTRAMVKSSVENRKPNAALLEAKRKAKLLKMQQPTQLDGTVKDIFQNVNMNKCRSDAFYIQLTMLFLFFFSIAGC